MAWRLLKNAADAHKASNGALLDRAGTMKTYDTFVSRMAGRSFKRALRRAGAGFVACAVFFAVLAVARATGWSALETIGSIGYVIAFAWGFVWTAIVGVISARAFQQRLREPTRSVDDIDETAGAARSRFDRE